MSSNVVSSPVTDFITAGPVYVHLSRRVHLYYKSVRAAAVSRSSGTSPHYEGYLRYPSRSYTRLPECGAVCMESRHAFLYPGSRSLVKGNYGSSALYCLFKTVHYLISSRFTKGSAHDGNIVGIGKHRSSVYGSVSAQDSLVAMILFIEVKISAAIPRPSFISLYVPASKKPLPSTLSSARQLAAAVHLFHLLGSFFILSASRFSLYLSYMSAIITLLLQFRSVES